MRVVLQGDSLWKGFALQPITIKVAEHHNSNLISALELFSS